METNEPDEKETKLIFELLQDEEIKDVKNEATENKEVSKEATEEKPKEITEEPQQVEPVIKTEETNPHPEGWKYKKGCECEKCKAHRDYQKNYQASRRAATTTPTTEKKPEQAPTATQKVETAEEKLNREMSGYTQTQPAATATPGAPPTNTPPPINMSDYVNGTMLLMALDYTFPLFAKYVIGMFDSKFKRLNEAGIKALQLTDAETKKLEPMADELVKILFATIPPAWAFVFFWGTTTFYKVMMLDETKHFHPAPAPKTKPTTT